MFGNFIFSNFEETSQNSEIITKKLEDTSNPPSLEDLLILDGIVEELQNKNKNLINFFTKEKIKQISSPKKERQNNNSNPAIIINEQDESILYEIYLNRLHPPPIGTFSKDLNFDNNLNFTALSPVIKNNKKIILGDGSFSVVQLYEDKKTRIKYAVKKMNN